MNDKNEQIDLISALGLKPLEKQKHARYIEESYYLSCRKSNGRRSLCLSISVDYAKSLGWVDKKITVVTNSSNVLGFSSSDEGYTLNKSGRWRYEVKIQWNSTICKLTKIGHLNTNKKTSGNQIIIEIDKSSFE